ncbi:MAG: VOC family protein [Acidobacteria bacterium]|nr:VOC family protein [Acidobacteriota bacterium]
MPEPFTLAAQPVIAFVSTRDPARARLFYGDTLGLRLLAEQLPFALVFDAHGTMLRVTVVTDLTPPPYTVLGWRVADIAAAAAALRNAGVQFVRYPGMPQDEHGVWTSPDGSKVAWFKDPDGNTLSISELV